MLRLFKRKPFFKSLKLRYITLTVLPSVLVLPVSKVISCWPFYISSLLNSNSGLRDFFYSTFNKTTLNLDQCSCRAVKPWPDFATCKRNGLKCHP